jgi:hypothetical protein
MPLEPHSDLILPPDGTLLWRYLDFAKFMHLLESRSLWFPRTDQFEDPLEGTFTDAEIEHLQSLFANLPVSGGYLKGPKYMRTTTYVNCWRAGAGESLAMWDLYGKGSGIVAVKSTVEKLKEAVAESPLRIFLGKVNYVDWSRAPWDNNALTMCFRKDLSYQHEAEVRAVIWDVDIVERNMSDALIAARLRSDYPHSGEDSFILRKEDGQGGVAIPFSIQRFVTEVVVGPREKKWVEELVRRVLKTYQIEIKLTASDRLTPR